MWVHRATDRDAVIELVARAYHEWQFMGCVQWDDDPGDTATSGDQHSRNEALDVAERIVGALEGRS